MTEARCSSTHLAPRLSIMSTSWLDSLNGSRFGNAPRVPLMQGRVMDDDQIHIWKTNMASSRANAFGPFFPILCPFGCLPFLVYPCVLSRRKHDVITKQGYHFRSYSLGAKARRKKERLNINNTPLRWRSPLILPNVLSLERPSHCVLWCIGRRSRL